MSRDCQHAVMCTTQQEEEEEIKKYIIKNFQLLTLQIRRTIQESFWFLLSRWSSDLFNSKLHTRISIQKHI